MIRHQWPGLWRDVVLNRVIASPLVPISLRWRLLRAYGMDVQHSRISPDVWFGSRRVTIGADTFINYRCFLNTSAAITIGSRCDIGMGVLFATSSHELGDPTRRAGAPTADPIVVGDAAWIGGGSILLPGVTVGEGAVVAAGSVVTRDVPPHTLAAGSPARVVRDLA